MAKYDITTTKKMKFARFGGLSSVVQKGYKSVSVGFHAPPARRGFYAFVWPYYEFFLLGGYANQIRSPGSKFTYVRDKDGKIIGDTHPDYEKLSAIDSHWEIPTKIQDEFVNSFPHWDDADYKKKVDLLEAAHEEKCVGIDRWVLIKKPSPRIFEYDGEIWHHLGKYLRGSDIIKSHGDWVKTDMKHYKMAFNKEMHSAKKSEMSTFDWNKKRALPSSRSPFRNVNKDHLEVFIEKI
jgi:hypothetical protein